VPLVEDEVPPLLLVKENLLDQVGLLLLELAGGDEEGEGLVDVGEGQVKDLRKVAAHNLIFFRLLLLEVGGCSESPFDDCQLPLDHLLHPFAPVLDYPHVLVRGQLV
jgi:hypothetical protein